MRMVLSLNSSLESTFPIWERPIFALSSIAAESRAKLTSTSAFGLPLMMSEISRRSSALGAALPDVCSLSRRFSSVGVVGVAATGSFNSLRILFSVGVMFPCGASSGGAISGSGSGEGVFTSVEQSRHGNGSAPGAAAGGRAGAASLTSILPTSTGSGSGATTVEGSGASAGADAGVARPRGSRIPLEGIRVPVLLAPLRRVRE